MDDLRVVISDINSAIPIGGGVASVKTINHNPLEKEIVRKVGKYTGFQFLAERSPVDGIIELGKLYWNGSAMNKNDESFTVSVSEKTADGDNIGNILELITEGSILHFKDFAGRSSILRFYSYEEKTDTEDKTYFDLYVIGMIDSQNYAYQPDESEVGIIEFIVKQNDLPSYDGIYKYKQKGQSALGVKNTGAPGEVGDIYEGVAGIVDGVLVYGQSIAYLGGGLEDPDNFKIISYVEYSLT